MLTARGSNARRLEVLRAALASKDPLSAVRGAIEEDNPDQQVVVWAYACILETNSAGLGIVFDRFEEPEVARIAKALEAIGASKTLSDLRVLQAAVAQGEASGLSRLDASEALEDQAEPRRIQRQFESQVAEMEACLLSYCRDHLDSLAAGGRTSG